MPLYGSNPWLDLSQGTSGLQQSMANVALAQRQAQYRMQQEAAKMALEQQYLGIARQAEERQGRATGADIAYKGAEQRRADAETKKYGTEDEFARQTMATQGRLGRLQGYNRSPNLDAMMYDPSSRDMIMKDLTESSVIPRGSAHISPQQIQMMMQDPLMGPEQALGPQTIRQSIQAALGGQGFQQAMGTPASAERYSEPILYNPNQIGVDPYSNQVLRQAPPAPMSDYQRTEAAERNRHNLAGESNQMTPEQRLILAQMHSAAGAVGRPRAEWQTVDMDALNEVLSGAGNRFMGRTNNPSAKGLSNEVYSSEDEARQKGAKTGDIVYIQGVGKVRLH